MDFWDEHQWEDFLRESDKRTELFHQVWEAYVRDNPPPEDDAAEADREAWDAAFQEHLAEKMGWDHSEGDGVPEWMIDALESDDIDDEDLEDEGEAWKAGLAEDFPEDQDIADLPVYRAAEAFREAVMAWVRNVPEERKGSVLVELCTAAIQTVTLLRSAHLMGYDMEMLGGNIAKSKRALNSANRSLSALHHFREAPFMLASDYQRLYEQAYEVRNALGVHVQHLRERFERGVE